MALAAALGIAPGAAPAQWLAPSDWEFFGELELEGTAFFEGPQFPGQESQDASVAGKATLAAEWLGGDLAARLTPFARIDAADDRRSHWDLREAKIDWIAGDWSVRAGADTVFWGKTEAVHLVDIVNQTDGVEDIDDEDRLGQPMIRVARLTGWGEISAFYFPWQRERTFAGRDGRLRPDPAVAEGRAIYETGAGAWTPSFALRYSGVIGEVDLGLSIFHGLGRDPSFLFDGTSLRPVYQRITQGGFDVQYTSGATLWKAEGIARFGEKNADFREEDFVALTGGLEHTLFGILDGPADLGLIAEYAWDSRGDAALTAFQNDLVLGARLTLNDEAGTSALLTGAVDTTDGGVAPRLEAERRLGPRWSLGLEGVGFVNQPATGLLASFRDDSFLRLKLRYFF